MEFAGVAQYLWQTGLGSNKEASEQMGRLLEKPFRGALGFGAVAGMRTMLAPAALGWAARQNRVPGLESTPFAPLGSRPVSSALYLFSLGELLADKTPNIVSRLAPQAILGRAASGALTGAALFASSGCRKTSGAALGGSAALLSAYVFYHLRRKAGESTGVSDPLLGLFEDGVAFLIISRSLTNRA